MTSTSFFRIICTVLLAVFCQALWAESIDLSGRMTPVKHQGRRNTCNAFAATALMEYLLKEQTGNEYDLSEAYTYYLGKTRALTTPFEKKSYSVDDGLAGFLAVKALQYGCMDEGSWPYEPKNWLQQKDTRCTFTNGKPDLICFIGCPPADAKPLALKAIPVFIEPSNFGTFLLKNKKPIVYNVLWCMDAVNDQTGEVRMPKGKEATENVYGHVILLVGYDSESRQFVFRNSWGEGWGNKGYGTIPEEYLLTLGECNQFKPFSKYPQEVREFFETGSLGVSAELNIE